MMRMRYVLVLFVLFSYCFGPSGTAQSQQSSSEASRKLVRKVDPTYPQTAKRMNIAGTVKVIAVVASDGKVTKVEPIGGSPLLIEAAQNAVSQWKFVPGSESREVVEFHFNP
jgi:TonB family protein